MPPLPLHLLLLQIDDDLTPCVCLGPQRVIHANFGSTEFVFNIFELIQSRDKKKVQEIYQVGYYY